MARSLKKGPFADHHLLAKVEKASGQEKKTSDKNMVTSFNNIPKFRRDDICCI